MTATEALRRNDPGSRVEVVPVNPTIGAEIRGIDLREELDEPSLDAIKGALAAHKVIFFRDQDITPEQQVAFGRRFGELTVHPFTEHLAHLPEVMVLDNHQDNPVFATDIWHSDETFREVPPMGSILRCVRIPPAGGDTLWADMVAAYEGLSDKMQRFLSGLEAIHDFKPFRRKFDALPSRERHARLAEMEEQLPNPTHPVVRTHPVTGKKAIFVNRQFTLAIKDMHEDESRTLLELLFAQALVPEYQVRFRWAPHSIAFWDNAPTQHYAANDYWPVRRTMYRVTVKGTRPF